jgi:hypothetical protein
MCYLDFIAILRGHGRACKIGHIWPVTIYDLLCGLFRYGRPPVSSKKRGIVGDFEAPSSPSDGGLPLAFFGGNADNAGTGGEAGRRERAFQPAR